MSFRSELNRRPNMLSWFSDQTPNLEVQLTKFRCKNLIWKLRRLRLVLERTDYSTYFPPIFIRQVGFFVGQIFRVQGYFLPNFPGCPHTDCPCAWVCVCVCVVWCVCFCMCECVGVCVWTNRTLHKSAFFKKPISKEGLSIQLVSQSIQNLHPT